MDIRDVLIALLVGIVTNIATFLATRNFTTSRERERFKNEEQGTRARAADSAVGHLRSSYYAVKQLALEVLDRQRKVEENAQFSVTLWGIRSALEQIRLSLQGHMNAWKNELDEKSAVRQQIERIVQEDVIAGQQASAGLLAAQLSDGKVRHAADKKVLVPDVLDQPKDVAPPREHSLLEAIRVSPTQRVMKMIAQGDVKGVEEEVVLAAERRGDITKIVALGGMLAMAGSERAHGILVESMRSRYSEMDRAAKVATFTAIVQFYVRQDREPEGIATCEELGGRILADEGLAPEDKAHACNQMGIILHGADRIKEAVTWEQKALELSPNDATYVCNHAQSYEKLGDAVQARQLYERSLALDDKDPNHILAAAHFFHMQGDHARAKELLAKLETIDAEKAEMLRLLLTVP